MGGTAAVLHRCWRPACPRDVRPWLDAGVDCHPPSGRTSRAGSEEFCGGLAQVLEDLPKASIAAPSLAAESPYQPRSQQRAEVQARNATSKSGGIRSLPNEGGTR